MKARAAKTRFLKRLETAGLSLEALTPAGGIEAMIGFYEDERADGCELDNEGDMLLFQWGTNDWGDLPGFDINITRQLIVTDEEEEPRQLALTFRFNPSEAPPVRDGNRWCESLSELAEFGRFVTASAALKAVGKRTPISVTLRHGRT